MHREDYPLLGERDGYIDSLDDNVAFACACLNERASA